MAPIAVVVPIVPIVDAEPAAPMVAVEGSAPVTSGLFSNSVNWNELYVPE